MGCTGVAEPLAAGGRQGARAVLPAAGAEWEGIYWRSVCAFIAGRRGDPRLRSAVGDKVLKNNVNSVLDIPPAMRAPRPATVRVASHSLLQHSLTCVLLITPFFTYHL